MIADFVVTILLVGIPFLLYCLWNFGRELKSHRSRIVVSPISSAAHAPAIPISSFRTRSFVVRLHERSRSAS